LAICTDYVAQVLAEDGCVVDTAEDGLVALAIRQPGVFVSAS
jgi:hypothetical protein